LLIMKRVEMANKILRIVVVYLFLQM
jgi:hypothetical protein